MKISIVEIVMLGLIKQSLKINTIRKKMRNFANQSVLCSMYRKLIEGAAKPVKCFVNDCGFIERCDGLQFTVKSELGTLSNLYFLSTDNLSDFTVLNNYKIDTRGIL